jgi:hypothetical protein
MAAQSTAVAHPNGNSSRALAAAGQDVGKAMEAVMINGDLGQLSPLQRTEYYGKVCSSLGLNPLTKPFAYIKLNGKLTLYALKDCTDQLRKLNGVSIEIVDRKVTNGLCIVTARARDGTGRQDEDIGVVRVDGLEGEAAANALMKATTKAKRRVTLSISGLGFSDESEVDAIPGAERIAVDDLYADQEGYLVNIEEEWTGMDAVELKEAWDAHVKNSQHRLDADHAIKALRVYEAAMKHAATAAKE